MALRLLLPLVALLPAAGPVAALTFERCNKSEIAYATAAVEGARDIAMRAAARVGPTPEYERWFGPYRVDRGEVVRSAMKAIDRALDEPSLRLVCPNVGEDGCDVGTFANVWPDQPHVVNLCGAFFGMPTIGGVVQTSRVFDSGTREGTIIHEVSHFTIVAGTSDHCYTREICSEMALTDPALAVENADSLQYFAEDVVLAAPDAGD